MFAGWNPAVAGTVTGNATYSATWKEDKNNNGVADDEEDKYTVTYTDGVEGEEVFADQVYGNLLSGTATPKFNGTPARSGYVFAGWSPAVAGTVTGNATYVAQWEKKGSTTDPTKPGKPIDPSRPNEPNQPSKPSDSSGSGTQSKPNVDTGSTGFEIRWLALMLASSAAIIGSSLYSKKKSGR